MIYEAFANMLVNRLTSRFRDGSAFFSLEISPPRPTGQQSGCSDDKKELFKALKQLSECDASFGESPLFLSVVVRSGDDLIELEHNYDQIDRSNKKRPQSVHTAGVFGCKSINF